MGRDVIIACDFNSKDEVMNFLDKFKDEKPFVKIGMELFYAEGPAIVKEIKARGHKIFLDLKLHDIPNTVKKSMAVLSNLDVDMTNLHAGGTNAMMAAGLEGLTSPWMRRLCTMLRMRWKQVLTEWFVHRLKQARFMRPAERNLLRLHPEYVLQTVM